MSRGKHGPKPWTQRQASTLFLRVPVADWVAVKRGHKREFRAGSGLVSQIVHIPTPVPVVAYAVNRSGEHDAKLMVLERAWREPLGAITEESLAAEGFANLAEFREYWIEREKRRFTPLKQVACFRVREFEDRDVELCGALIITRLYGEWLDDGA